MGRTAIGGFQALKDALCSSDIMAYPDFTSTFNLTTNPSGVPLAAVFSQVQNAKEMLRF
jgi:hypothetical protein